MRIPNTCFLCGVAATRVAVYIPTPLIHRALRLCEGCAAQSDLDAQVEARVFLEDVAPQGGVM